MVPWVPSGTPAPAPRGSSGPMQPPTRGRPPKPRPLPPSPARGRCGDWGGRGGGSIAVVVGERVSHPPLDPRPPPPTARRPRLTPKGRSIPPPGREVPRPLFFSSAFCALHLPPSLCFLFPLPFLLCDYRHRSRRRRPAPRRVKRKLSARCMPFPRPVCHGPVQVACRVTIPSPDCQAAPRDLKERYREWGTGVRGRVSPTPPACPLFGVGPPRTQPHTREACQSSGSPPLDPGGLSLAFIASVGFVHSLPAGTFLSTPV